MDFTAWLTAERARHVAAIERMDQQLAYLGGTVLPRKTPAACVAILETDGGAMSPSQVTERLREQGRDVSDVAVSQALCRLAKAGAVERERERGKYKAKERACSG